MAIYKGFSTLGKSKKYHLTDFDLIKQDIYNNLNIRPGEKLMNPAYGCIIWNLLFEPLTQVIKNEIVKNLTAIIKNDPRVSSDNILVSEFKNGLMVQIQLKYLQTDETDTMLVRFNRTT